MIEYMIVFNMIFFFLQWINKHPQSSNCKSVTLRKARPNTVVTLLAVTKKG